MRFKYMQTITDIFGGLSFPAPVKKSRRTERGDFLDTFTARINAERDGVKYKKFTKARIAFFISHIPTSDLYFFLKQCESYSGPFSKCFFGSLKVK